MVTASQLQAASANNYKYALSNDQYKALANENNTQQQQGQPLTTEEQYRQRKGLSTEKASSAQPVQAVAAAQPAAQNNTANAAQVTQSAAPINKTSGLPQGETFQYTLSHAQQNKFVRENQSKVAAGQPALTELQFRKNIGMDTSTVGGTYTAPKVTNNSYTAATPATSTKDVGSTNKAATGSGDQKIAAQKAASSGNSNASAVSGTAQQAQAQVVSATETAKRNAAVKAENDRIAAQAKIDAQNAANAKRSAAQEAATKEKAAIAARAEASKTANASVKAAATKRANELQKQADDAKKAAKAAEDDADAKAKLANVYGEASYYSEIAARTGNAAAARKAAIAVKGIKSVKAEAQKTSAKAKAAGVTSHEGQILLKDGTWISQHERKGNDAKDSVKIYSSQAEYNKVQAERKAKAKKDAAAAQGASSAYKVVVAKDGKIIDAIQANGLFGTGAGSVRIVTVDRSGKVVAASKSAEEYQSTLKAAIKNAAIPVTSSTSAEDVKTIKEARSYVLNRMSGSAKTEQKEKYNTVDGVFTSQLEKSLAKKIGAAGAYLQSKAKKGSEGARDGAFLVKLSQGDLSENVKTTLSTSQKALDAGFARQITPMFTEIERVNSIVNSALANTSITINDSGRWAITKKGKESIKGVTFNAKASKEAAIKENAVLGGIDAYVGESYANIKAKPVTAAAGLGLMVAGGVVAGTVIKGVGLGANLALRTGATRIGAESAVRAAASKGLYTAANYTEKVVNFGMLGSLAVDVNNLRKEGDYKELSRTIVNLAIGGIGFKKGDALALKGIDRIRARGGVEIPVESIVSSDVLTGKTAFPMTKHGTPVRETIESFKDAEGESIGYHASPTPIYPKVRASVARQSDQAGLYVAPLESGASMYFARISKDTKPLGTLEALSVDISTLAGAAGKVTKADLQASAKVIASRALGKQGVHPTSVIELKDAVKSTPKNVVDAVLGTPGSLPTVQKIRLPGEVKRMPKEIRLDLEATQKAMETADKGDAFITFKFERNIKKGRAETEATITPSTVLKRINTEKRYFKYNGRVVTLTEYRALAEKGKIPAGQMGERELTASQKKKLAERFKKVSEDSKQKVYSSESKQPRQGVRVVPLEKLLTSKSMASIRKVYQLSKESKIRPAQTASSKNAPVKHSAYVSKKAAGSDSKVSTSTKSKASASKTSRAVNSKTSTSRAATSRTSTSRTTQSGTTPSRTSSSKKAPSRTAPSRSSPSRTTTETSSKGYSESRTYSTSGSGSGTGRGSTTVIPPTTRETVIFRKKRQTDEKKVLKSQKDMVQLTRQLKNTLGSLNSVFDLPSKKAATRKTTKRSTKRVSRA
ncbi:hypothetical protein RG963_06790 [Methanosarcina sp. Z-7115]|uniref:Uncharacterized protein n=1 Tax=Methanosarcina baikalica TaxID=3073890 RepID=A0ABU2D0J8_9EURY|nr:hypothetical protein [Methanosarcina sp. Z-7115]MDR7665489.1 hypothetical protein [Methanosarcina sp. Z-7115]